MYNGFLIQLQWMVHGTTLLHVCAHGEWMCLAVLNKVWRSDHTPVLMCVIIQHGDDCCLHSLAHQSDSTERAYNSPCRLRLWGFMGALLNLIRCYSCTLILHADFSVLLILPLLASHQPTLLVLLMEQLILNWAKSTDWDWIIEK